MPSVDADSPTRPDIDVELNGVLIQDNPRIAFSARMRGEHSFSVPPTPLGRALSCVPCTELLGSYQGHSIVVGNAYDIIIVQSSRGYFSNQYFTATFPIKLTAGHRLVLRIETEQEFFKDDCNSCCTDPTTNDSHVWNPIHDNVFDINSDGSTATTDVIDELAKVLRQGPNPIRYLLLYTDQVVGMALATIFLWSSQDRLVVSDIDGTITRSNAGGIFDTILTERYSYCHEHICHFLSELVAPPATHILYVTSRPISLASRTRKFLNTLRQGTRHLPRGPILGFGGTMSQLLIMELITRTTHNFKAEQLWKYVTMPFRLAGLPKDKQVFAAAFGNTMMDVQAYDMVGVPFDRIFLLENSKILAFGSDSNSNTEQEFVNLTETKYASDSWGPEIPHSWYRARVCRIFATYGDPELWEYLSVYSKGEDSTQLFGAT